MTDINKALEKLNEDHREQLGKYAHYLRVGHGVYSKEEMLNRITGYLVALKDSGIITEQDWFDLHNYYLNRGKREYR